MRWYIMGIAGCVDTTVAWRAVIQRAAAGHVRKKPGGT
jgi:hypothetical protein